MTQDADGKPGAGSADAKGTDAKGTDAKGTDEAAEVTAEPSDVPGVAASTLGSDEPVEEPAPIDKSTTDAPAGTPDPDNDADFGDPGPPINRNGPFYIGFVGAIESKEALLARPDLASIVVRGRRGGSAMVAAAVNALASAAE